ncbi:methyl-accepting chemotaxis protein [Pseudoduganella namucuonensis]|uniref:Methyl-accepting chemotaxis sensory transducer with Pas/Pac sensor n=1 Tax=Pseudoduganella namucuonensis TaxID=1035707 RepID=A0A1I7LUF6_9BURK|nr:PAS domain-containing methyl-accepting chemotaxis protein [Pseudoduganella namucuonensis]SFV13366.1 methyl-accepting chemotaxis sensory transducer with Pas/Pac sensor [Pseudoduganella namucuonensis]
MQPGQHLISRTDLASRIRYVNQTFVHVSGYDEAELLGATNELFRHPDTPAAVFDDIWATLKAGRVWSGVMAHRRKDGASFWAHATISPLHIDGRLAGYTTVRSAPGEQALRLAVDAYSRLRAARPGRGPRLRGGAIHLPGPSGWLAALAARPLHARAGTMAACSAAGLLCLGALPYSGAAAAWGAGALFAVQLAAGWRLRRALLPLRSAHDLCRQVTAGDLGDGPATAPRFAADSLDGLSGSVHAMRQSLGAVMRQVASGAVSVAEAAGEIDDGNRRLSAQTEQQAAALQEAAATMAQLAVTVRQNAAGAGEATRLAANTAALAGAGSGAVRQLVGRIDGMAAGAASIAEFIGEINGVALQTNILALNAAVEAARAGEQGRGFAVVATEVRMLAQRSAAAAEQIGLLIRETVAQIADAGRLGADAAGKMEEVVQAARLVSDLGGGISAASAEQSGGIAQLSQAVAHMDQATQRNAAQVERLAVTASALAGQAGALRGAVAVFHC